MDAILIAAYLLVAVLIIAGLAGSLLPFLPGTPLIFLGALVYALATDFHPITPGKLLFLAGLAALAHVLDYVAGAVGARKFGGSGWAVVGALIGGVVGLFFGLPGLLVGPVVGAVAGELLKSGELGHSLKAGFGALLGIVLAVIARFAIAFTMMGLFLWSLWRG
jgi:uncharacterized protein YqgC (DUF456 family)